MSENVAEFQPAETTEDETSQGEQSSAGTQSSSDTGSGETRDVGGVAGDRLRSFIERIERLEEEKAHLAEDIKETYGEAKGVGFDVKTIRKIVSLRKMDGEKRRESEELLDLYKSAIGMY